MTSDSPSSTSPEARAAFLSHPELQSALLPLAEEHSVLPGETIYHQGAMAKGIYLVMGGSIRLYMLDDKGREIFSKTRNLGVGCILGLPATLCSTPYNFTAQATESCRIGFIETMRLNCFLRERTDLCMEIVQIMSRELAEMKQTRTSMKSCANIECALNGTCQGCN